MEIRLAESKDVRAYWAHLRRHSRESGTDGDLVFDPLDEGWNGSLQDIHRNSVAHWCKMSSQPGWERCWILSEKDEIFGEVKLTHKPALKSSLHRATLSMGIERPYRGKGWGYQLLSGAISWAKTQNTLSWIDLFVFEHNLPARSLYQKLGFIQIGQTLDSFRMSHQKISEIKMVLELKVSEGK